MKNNSETKILIAGGDPKQIQLLGSILIKEKFDVSYFMSGEDALKAVEKNNYDILLLDSKLKDGSGFDLCRKIKNELQGVELPVLMISAKALKQEIVEGFEAGAEDYITKPFNTNELLARVHTHLEIKRQREFLKIMNQELERQVKERTEKLSFERDMNKKLRTKYEAIFHLAPVGMIVINSKNKEVLEVNKRVAELVGSSIEEILVNFWDIVSNIECKAVNIKTKVLNRELFIADTCITSMKGHKTYLRFSGEPIDLHSEGDYFLLIQDITVSKKWEQSQYVLKDTLIKLKDTIRVDELTGLANLLEMQYKFTDFKTRFERSRKEFSIMYLSIKPFIEVMDFSREKQNRIIEISHFIRESVRKQDAVARVSDMNFMLLLPETSYSGALKLKEKLEVLISYRMKRLKIEGEIIFGLAWYNDNLFKDQVFENLDINIERK